MLDFYENTSEGKGPPVIFEQSVYAHTLEAFMKKRALPVAVLVLTVLGFTLGTCEFVIVGILPDIATGLNVPLSAVGRLVSVFAAFYAVGTPLLTAATGRIPRFRLLTGLLAAFLGVNLLSMVAANVVVLYISRMLAALVSGPLTAVAMLYAKDVAPEGRTALSVSMVYTGFSVASVLGVPLGTSICHLWGWRATFAVILVMAAVLTPVLLRLLPRVSPVSEVESGFFRQFAVLRDRRMYSCVLMIVLNGCATYTVYTYLTPILTETLGLSESAVSPVLMVVGLCCLASNLLSGWMGEHGGLRRLPVVFAVQTVLFAMMPLLLGHRISGLAAVLIMAVCMYILNTPSQVHALDLAEREYPFAANLCATALSVSYNFGIAIGSFAGSTVQEHWGFRMLGAPAAVFALLSLAESVRLLRTVERGRKTV